MAALMRDRGIRTATMAGADETEAPQLGQAAAAVLLAVTLVGCTSSPAPAANTVERTVEISAGEFFEANLEMNESSHLTYEWTTADGSQVAFDVHSHTYTGVRYHARDNGSAGQGTFTAPSNGTYSLLWENPGDEPATVELTIEGDFVVESFAP